ncbi:mediator of RNA polymerase II transcription subunit 1-like isoform X3 [Pungitius pungitius]|uniref:mediator of RNA polymerase II transcription subunit 1-like isoform X3 n=1 Tax=Pungitius pungitius TaxID=134920 RepID=UPI002E1613FD
MESKISKLHLKFAEKTWHETFQLVRRCMDKPKDKSQPCKPLVSSLERLQEVFNVSSMRTMRSRLEMIAKQQGMGFHLTEATCYLTAELFYLEVVLLPYGGVEEVKVAPHGKSPVPSESFLQLLRSKDFDEFSVKLAGLFTQYNIPGDEYTGSLTVIIICTMQSFNSLCFILLCFSETRLKLFSSMQWLWRDLQQISQLPSVPKDSDPRVDMINHGRSGCLIAGQEDCPMTIQFHTAPTDGTKASDRQTAAAETLVQAARVTVGVSDAAHRLQMASLLPQPPQLDPQGHPVFLSFAEAPHETLPACFLLKLQPAVPMTLSFVNGLRQITDVPIPDVDLQWAPLPKLLTGRSLGSVDEQDTIYTVGIDGVSVQPLPGGAAQRYVLLAAAWEEPAQRAAAVHSVPFTHPAHVPALLQLLRHRSAINALLRSCMGPPGDAAAGSFCGLHLEVLPESETSFSVTFQRPDADSLAVLLVNVRDSNQITCTLFGSGIVDPSLDEYLSCVMRRFMSVPVTLKTLHGKLEEFSSAPLSPGRPPTAEADNDHSSAAAVTDPNGALAAHSQSATGPEEGCAAAEF